MKRGPFGLSAGDCRLGRWTGTCADGLAACNGDLQRSGGEAATSFNDVACGGDPSGPPGTTFQLGACQ